jgi:hypothetical protein
MQKFHSLHRTSDSLARGRYFLGQSIIDKPLETEDHRGWLFQHGSPTPRPVQHGAGHIEQRFLAYLGIGAQHSIAVIPQRRWQINKNILETQSDTKEMLRHSLLLFDGKDEMSILKALHSVIHPLAPDTCIGKWRRTRPNLFAPLQASKLVNLRCLIRRRHSYRPPSPL